MDDLVAQVKQALISDTSLQHVITSLQYHRSVAGFWCCTVDKPHCCNAWCAGVDMLWRCTSGNSFGLGEEQRARMFEVLSFA